MISPKFLIKIARKWQKIAAIKRRRQFLPEANQYLGATSTSSSPKAEKGHFVVYSTDKKRFVLPMSYLNNYIFKELFRLSEEEFGLPTDGPIRFPCDTVFMDYVIALIRSQPTKQEERALLMSITTSRCIPSYSLVQLQSTRQPLVCG